MVLDTLPIIEPLILRPKVVDLLNLWLILRELTLLLLLSIFGKSSAFVSLEVIIYVFGLFRKRLRAPKTFISSLSSLTWHLSSSLSEYMSYFFLVRYAADENSLIRLTSFLFSKDSLYVAAPSLIFSRTNPPSALAFTLGMRSYFWTKLSSL